MKAFLSVLALSCVAVSAIQNPSFDDGLNGWDSVGTASASIPGFATLQAYGTVSVPSGSIADIVAFAPSIDGVIPHAVIAGTDPWVQVYFGSAIQQSFSISEDSTISVDFQRLGDHMQVFAVVLNGPGGTQSWVGSDWPTSFSQAIFPGAWTRSFSAPAGDYELVIANLGGHWHRDVSDHSFLYVDGVRIQPQTSAVPDGGLSAGLLGLGLLGLAFVRR